MSDEIATRQRILELLKFAEQWAEHTDHDAEQTALKYLAEAARLMLSLIPHTDEDSAQRH